MSTQADKFQALAAQVQAVCPIIGATVDDKNNFVPTFDPSATPAQQQAAASAIAAFNWNANLPIDNAINALRAYASATPAQTLALGIPSQQDAFNRAVIQALKYLNTQIG